MSRRRRQIDDDVPRLPRGRGMTLTTGQLLKILMTAGMLVAVIVLQKPCATAAGKFVGGFDNPDAAPGRKAIPRPEELDVPGSSGIYVPLEGLTEAEKKAAIEKAMREAADKRGTGSGGGSGSGSGNSGSAGGSGGGSGGGGGSGAASDHPRRP